MKTLHKKPKPKLRPSETNSAPALPSREAIKAFLTEAHGKVGVREIARAFGVGPDNKKGLRGLLRSLQADGVLDRAGPKQFRDADTLPENAMVQVTGIDRDGEALARPVNWTGKGRPADYFHAG